MTILPKAVLGSTRPILGPKAVLGSTTQGSQSWVVQDHTTQEKVGLKLNIQKTKIMASGPITLWEIDGETVETVSDFFGGEAPK